MAHPTSPERLNTRGSFRPAGERLITLDALRGFAILGILLPNIFTFAWPSAAMMDASVMGDSWWNQFAHDLNATAFLGKFMFNFAMLFGAGVVLFDRKTAPRGGIYCFDCRYDLQGLSNQLPCPECGSRKRVGKLPKVTDGWALWYRRCAALLVLGLIHGYFFWYGDILFYYAASGLTLVWWVRKWPASVQIPVGIAMFLFGSMLVATVMYLGILAVGKDQIPATDLVPPPGPEIEAYLGTWLDALRARAPATFVFQVFMLILFMPGFWGMMMLGMGLTKAGVLTGERTTRFHALLCVAMLLLGTATTLPLYLHVRGLELDVPNGFVWQTMAQTVGIPLAIGYSQLIVLACRAWFLRVPVRGLANVGRMALTNYFSHTLICTTLFYGYGFGYFASVPFPHLFGVIVAIWIFNFAFSALWLRHFRFGPFEWLWRQMTYLGIRSG